MNGLNTIETARVEISTSSIWFQWGDMLYNEISIPGYNGEFIKEAVGVEVAGFWSKAWKIARGDSAEVEEAWGDIILAAVETVVETPEITEQGAGFLLQAATWKAQNTRRKREHTYMRTTHNIQEISLDEEHSNSGNDGDNDSNELHEAIAAPMVDHDLIMAVRSVVRQIEDEEDRELCQLLMEGYSESECAERLNRSRSWVTYHKAKRLAPVLEALIN